MNDRRIDFSITFFQRRACCDNSFSNGNAHAFCFYTAVADYSTGTR
jgi:hypothetical protein